jgi:excisionase family DNA binding protein
MKEQISREAAAARKLGEAILELLSAVNESTAERVASTLSPKVTSVSPQQPASSPRALMLAGTTRPPEPILMTQREAAKALGISQRKLWDMTAPRGPIPVVKLGTLVRFAPEDLRRAVLECKVNPATE